MLVEDPGVSYGVPVNPYNLRGEEPTRRVLEKTNYLVAYSTLLGMGAMEDPHHGSFWMQILTPMLLDDRYVEKTIFDILTSVNEEMNKHLNDLGLPIQQPALYSCLNVDVRLLKEAKAIQPGDLKMLKNGVGVLGSNIPISVAFINKWPSQAWSHIFLVHLN